MKMVKRLVMAISLVLPLSACAWGAGGGGGFSFSAAEASTDGNAADLGLNPNEEAMQRYLAAMQSKVAAGSAYGGVTVSGGGAGASTPYGRAVAMTVSPRLVKGTYMGASLTAADPTLRAQLKLPAGVGLVVSGVDAEGPAKAAGLRETDVIQKIDDQWAINAAQFEVLVRMHKPGDKVEVTAIREAQPVKVTVTLTEKDVPDLAWSTNQGQGAGGGGVLRVANPVQVTTMPGGGFRMVVPGNGAEERSGRSGTVNLRGTSPTTRPVPATKE